MKGMRKLHNEISWIVVCGDLPTGRFFIYKKTIYFYWKYGIIIP